MDQSPSVLRSDDAPPDPDESPRSGEVPDVATDGQGPDADGPPRVGMHRDRASPDVQAPDAATPTEAETATDAAASPGAEPRRDAETAPHAEAAPDGESAPDGEAAPDGEIAFDRSSGPYPDDSLWPSGVRAFRPDGFGAELTPRPVDPFPLVARDPSDTYPLAPGPVDPGTLAVRDRAGRPRPMVLVLVAVAVVLAFSGASVGYSLLAQQKLYGAQAEFVLTPRSDLTDTAVDQAIQTQMVIVTSPTVLQTVAGLTGVGVKTLEDEVAVGMEGRSNVMQITVADADQERAVTIAQSVADTFPTASPKPPANQPPPITASLLTPARALEQPLQPQPVRALAVGILVGLLAAAIVVVSLWRPRTLRRPAPYWT